MIENLNKIIQILQDTVSTASEISITCSKDDYYLFLNKLEIIKSHSIEVLNKSESAFNPEILEVKFLIPSQTPCLVIFKFK